MSSPYQLPATGELAAARASNDFAEVDRLIRQVVESAASGDAQGLNDLCSIILTHRLAEGPIRQVLLSDDEVADATQATLIAVSRGIATFEGRARFTTWLFRVAHNEAMRVVQRNSRAHEKADELDGLADRVERMSSIVATRQDLLKALDDIEPRFRDPVVLRDIDGLDYQAVAEALEVPLNTAKTRIRRGREVLAARIMAMKHQVSD